MSAPEGQDGLEPIAIVGMAMRFPGGSHNAEQFWEMLSKGRSAHKKIPKERFDADGYYHPDAARAGAINVKGGYFLSEDPVLFDAPFFSMTSLEATGTDPQQRLMLEVAYESLENAGIPIQNVVGSQTSVFVGCFTNDFESVGGRDPFGGPFYAATGYGASMLSNRVSWFFDMRGPSLTVDTACSSSLYAVHLACQSLRAGESKMSLIGGTNLIYDPSYMRDMCGMTFLSPDGICHSFDHRANGYARGDGIGGMVLKTLKQALADGDTIRAVIRNSGLGQDGRTPGITMPSPQAHADLIRSTYAGAGLSLDQTSYFEAHGTGTSIGDPYELSAIGATFGKARDENNPIFVGSVKTNIGHLEGCAGLAGLIKATLVLERGQIPPLAGFEKANPRLRLKEWKVALPETLINWPTSGLRRVSVNSFGYGGANAHVIVDDAYHYLEEHGLKGNHQTTLFLNDSESDSGFSSEDTPTSEHNETTPPSNKLFVFSSADQAGLSRVSNVFANTFDAKLDAEKSLEAASETNWSNFTANLAYTLGSRRSALDHRTFVVSKSASDLSSQLQKPLPAMRRTAKNNNVFFIFTGQGAQWPTMGKELIGHQVYKQSLEVSQEVLKDIGCTWSIFDALFAPKETSQIDSPDFSQPLCTALQIALVDLLKTWGIQPKSVVGHSSGEIAAAYAAGALSQKNAIKVAYLRGVYSADVNRRLETMSGAMMAVGLSEEGVLPYLARVPPSSVVVACINAPNNVTLSGDEASIDQLHTIIAADGVFVRKLRVKTAYHSHHMNTIADDYRTAMGSLDTMQSAGSSGVTMFSSVTAAPIVANDLDANYWIKNMVSTVRFSEAVRALISQSAGGKTRRKVAVSYAAAIEIGPSDALKGPIMQIFTATDERLAASIMYTSMLSRNISAEVSAMSAAGRLWGQGLSVDLHAVNFQSGLMTSHQSLANLPPYPWNHSKGYWHSSAWGKTYRYLRKPRTDLLGLRLQNQDKSEPRWHNFLRLSEQPWIADHRVQQMILYPGAAMITMAIQAAHEVLDKSRIFKGIEARNILFKRPLLIPSGDIAVETAIHLRPLSDGGYDFRIFSQGEDQEWEENCSGSVLIHYSGGRDQSTAIEWQNDTSVFSMVRKRAHRKLAPRTFYKFFDKKMNLQYGPLHQNVTECVAGLREGYGKITVPDTKAVMPSQFEYPHLIHPATLDAIFHMQALGYLHTLSGDESLVPISIESVYVSADISTKPGSELVGYAKSEKTDVGDFTGDIVLSDDAWSSPKAVVRGFLSRDTAATAIDSTAAARQPRKCTALRWVEFNINSITDSEHDTVLVQTPSMALGPEILILCGSNASPAVDQLVEKVTKAMASFECVARVMRVSDLNNEELSGPVLSLLEVDQPVVSNWTESDLEIFKKVIAQTSTMLWVTRGGAYDSEESLKFSLTTGLLRTVRAEMPQLRLPHLDLSRSSDLDHEQNIDAILLALESSILTQDAIYEQEFIVRDDKLLVPRLGQQDSFHAELSSHVTKVELYEARLADLDNPVEGSLDRSTNEVVWNHPESPVQSLGEFELEVRTTAVNIEPVDLEMVGVLGRDAVGIVTDVGSAVEGFAAGDTVVVCASHTLKTSLRTHQDLVRLVPPFVDPNTLVTLPSALCTAQAVLGDIARLQTGEVILIAAKPGSIEQALISLATQIGAEVFVAAQNADHERLLIENLGLEEDHVLISTPGLPYMSTLATILEGKEVQVVATTLTGDPQKEAMNCLGYYGRFVSVGAQGGNTSRAPAPNNISVANLDLEQMRCVSPRKVASLFERSWARASKLGLPLTAPSRSFPLIKTQGALAHLKSARCFGSAVLKLAPDHKIMVPPTPPKRLHLDSTATYILSGGLGGIGRSIADMMFEAGARKIFFISRSGAKSDEAQHFLESLIVRGCNAQAFQCDITDPAQVKEFAARCVERGEKIKGVVQCAMVLRDSMFENMSFEAWSQCTQPKVQGSWNLHKHMPAELDFFIMLSSMAGVIGNPGQANYSAAGTYQDALSQYRRSKNLVSTTIDLGIVSDVGYIAENPEQFERLDYLENLFISERDLHIILSAAMLGQTRDGVLVPAQLVTGVGKELLSEGSLGFAMSADLKYAELHDSLKNGSGAVDSSEDALIKDNLKAAASVREACGIVEGVLSAQLARALNMESADVDLEKPMHAFGVDSLVAVEVKNMIFRRLEADISVFDILSTMPLAKLAVKIVSKSKFVREDIALSAQDEVTE